MLAELEASLLDRLANAEGSLLDDVELIDVLANIKTKSREVNEKLTEANEKKIDISEKREAFRPVAQEHINVYGAFTDERLTGLHETASINDFSYGVSDRGASIRIPIMTVENGWKGWLEDRRPASNGDPYKIAARIVKTVKGAE